MATIELHRPDERVNYNALVKIILDGKVIGEIANNEKKLFNVMPGVHTLKIKSDSQGSKTYRFNIRLLA